MAYSGDSHPAFLHPEEPPPTGGSQGASANAPPETSTPPPTPTIVGAAGEGGRKWIVRYGRMRVLGEFLGEASTDWLRGTSVVIRTERGTELGEVLCAGDARIQSYLLAAPPTPGGTPTGTVVRKATAEDLAGGARLAAKVEDGFRIALDAVAQRKLQMKLVDVEAIFGGERMVFYYLAEKRVDFRDLVKDLARVFHTRIEMRQIGVRDEAKLLADYGDCGKPVCCNTHLTQMPPVTMRMAKLQKTTLDPSKISGRCGRLKCCLRYEFETYQENEQELPPVNAIVRTAKGVGQVLALELLAKKVLVEMEDHRRLLLHLDDIETVIAANPASGTVTPFPSGQHRKDASSHAPSSHRPIPKSRPPSPHNGRSRPRDAGRSHPDRDDLPDPDLDTHTT